MNTINPYLVFNGNCEEAFNFYKMVFGGDIVYIGRFKDMPQSSRQHFPLSADEKVMHATLQINPETVLMGTDSIETYQKANGTIINNFFLYMSARTQADAYRIFDELSIEGKITMPMAPTFWSTHYGMVIDKFGIHWKITFDADKK